MSYVILLLLFGTFFHFIYQSALAPDMRVGVRERLLRLMEELRVLERAQGEHASQRRVSDLRESQARLLEAFDRISIVALIEVERELRADPRVREQVEARSKSFEGCESRELRSLRARTVRIALQAVAINNGGLIFSILPLMPFLLASAKFRNWVLRLTVQAIDFHQQLGPAYVRVKHDELSL